ncbi:MAG TPA: alpha/beta hydrolase fold domain-containing protein [Ilumatobacter sp.]
MTTSAHLPGRLGNPDLTLGDDPRTDPRVGAVFAALGLDGSGGPPPVDAASPYDQQLAFWDAAETGYQMLFGALYPERAPAAGVVTSTETITGVDGNEIALRVHRPAAGTAPVPGILHLHGGGMTILATTDANYAGWRDDLAAAGVVVVGVEFRNAAGSLGPHPFPAGLHDCASALQWMHDHRADLGVSKLVVSGDSGGANLALATVLLAKRDGRLGQIDGVYAQCPYISGRYTAPPPELPSLAENDRYFLDCRLMGAMAAVYDPSGRHASDPLAWPYHAEVGDLAGLPPHVISVNELDPLRDEGLAYFRKLMAAGVSATSRTVNGTCHAADVILRNQIRDVWDASLRDLVGFACSL